MFLPRSGFPRKLWLLLVRRIFEALENCAVPFHSLKMRRREIGKKGLFPAESLVENPFNYPLTIGLWKKWVTSRVFVLLQFEVEVLRFSGERVLLIGFLEHGVSVSTLYPAIRMTNSRLCLVAVNYFSRTAFRTKVATEQSCLREVLQLPLFHRFVASGT